MYQCAGGGIGDGDLERMLKREQERPHITAIIHMCLESGAKKDNRRTVNTDDAWEYFYELFSEVVATRTTEEVYEFFGSILPPTEIDEYIIHLDQHKRKTA